MSGNKAEQNWGYRSLEKAILRDYPKIHLDDEVKASYKRKGPLSWVISHLADRRRKQIFRQEVKLVSRKQFTRQNAQVLVSHSTSVDEAFNLLQVFDIFNMLAI